MSDLNSFSCSGRLGRDPELKASPGGLSVLRFSVAVGGKDKVDGEWKETTTWLGVVLFGKRAESLHRYLAKGDRVGVTGRLTVREYQGRDGVMRTAVDVIASDIALLGSKQDRAEKSSPADSKPEQTSMGDLGEDRFREDDSEIPF